jgi:hypothetical protein
VICWCGPVGFAAIFPARRIIIFVAGQRHGQSRRRTNSPTITSVTAEARLSLLAGKDWNDAAQIYMKALPNIQYPSSTVDTARRLRNPHKT